jgi:putative membrane protein
MDAAAGWHEWLKALHIVAVIAWMAGMLYLPRLYVYHCAAEPGSAQDATFQVMERRLLRAILNPAMIAAWVLGVAMAFGTAGLDWGAGWVWVKFGLLVAVQIVHAFYARFRRDFAAGRNRRSARFYRFANEAPTVLVIVIVAMAVVKPF